MATRLYYSDAWKYPYAPLTGLPVNAAFDPKAPNALRTSRGGSAAASPSYWLTSFLPGDAFPLVHLASQPLAAGPIAGTVKGQMRAYSNLQSSGDVTCLWLFLLDSEWAYKATLLNGVSAPSGTATMSAATQTNRQMPYGGPVEIAPQTAADGDRLLAMAGFRRHGNSAYVGSSYYVKLAYSSAGATDLPEDSTTTTDLAPWLEFSQDLTFLPDVQPPINGVGVDRKQVQQAFGGNLTRIPESSGGSGSPSSGQVWPR